MISHCWWQIYIRLCSFHFFRHHLTTFTFTHLQDSYHDISRDCVIYECKAKIVSEVIFLGLYAKGVSDLNFGHCINNDTPFMNPSSHPHLSVNKQERSLSPKEARLRLSRKIVQCQLPPFRSLPEPAEHQACWMKNSYFSEMMIWAQKDDTSVSRIHETDSWR